MSLASNIIEDAGERRSTQQLDDDEKILKILEVFYFPGNDSCWDSVDNNPDIKILEIDTRQYNPDFLKQNSFYTVLESASNLFFVDVAIAEGGITSDTETTIKSQLKNIKKPLIVQCGSLSITKVYIKEVNKEPIVLDLNTNIELFDENIFIENLSTKENFGLPLVVKALKSKLVGEFNDDKAHHRSLIRVTFDVNKMFDSWKLIDYAALYDDFLSAQFLSLYDWILAASNENGERTLRIAAEHANVNTLAALLDLPLPISNEKIILSDSKVALLNLSDNDGNTPLLIAVKEGKKNNVEFFIRCGADVNKCNTIKKCAIDFAWENKRHYIVLTLLKANSSFPNVQEKPFNLEVIAKDNDVPEELMAFLLERKTFLSWTEKQNLTQDEITNEEVTKFVMSHKSSEYLKNSQGQSEVLTNALNKGQYRTYAALQTIGVTFNNKKKQYAQFIELSVSQKEKLQKAIEHYFSPIKDAHIPFLVSKSKTSVPLTDQKAKEFEKEVEGWYRKLDEIDEISIILKVLAVPYSGMKDIIFDKKKDSVTCMLIDYSPTTTAVTDYPAGRIYVGAKMKEPELLGTLAHELAHFTMQVLYRNEYNPYEKSENGDEFEKITKNISAIADLDLIIANAFINYKQEKRHSELIVRVPHILAKYGKEKGTDLLSDQVPELLNYYTERIIPDCRVHIQKQDLIQHRYVIELLNQHFQIDTMQNFAIKVNNPIDIKDFLSQKQEKNFKNFLLIGTKSTLLSGCSVYQSLQKLPEYSKPCNFLFLRLDQFTNKIFDIFKSDAINLLVMIYSDNEQQIQNVLTGLKIILPHKLDKKVIFIIQKDEVIKLKNNLEGRGLANKYLELKDKAFTLNDLTAESQRNILQTLVTFQGKKISLNKLIDEKNEKLKKLIDSETIVKLIYKDEVKIGGELSTFDGYDKDYYIDRTFNRQILNKEKIFTAKENCDLLAINGTDKATLRESLIEDEKIRLFKEKDPNKNTPIRFIVLDNQEAEEQFKELCKQYPTYNIHWLKSESKTLIWQQSHGSVSGLLQYKKIDNNCGNDKSNRNYSEETMILENSQKVVIISDTAGMGKSVVLTDLANKIKEVKGNSLWVVRIDLNNYTKTLKEELENRKFNKPSFYIHDTNGITAVEFLLNKLLASDESSRLETSLEKELFKHSFEYQNKITVMFDGFDEISPRYKNIVMDLLQALKNSAVDQLWITTRPNIRQELEESLDVFAHRLKPFSKNDQIEFLTKFWKKALGLNLEGKEALEKYAQTLIDKFCGSISDKEKEFTGIALQMRMLAEIFQENKRTQKDWQGCKEFLSAFNKNKEPELPETLNLFDLYEQFVWKKFYEFHLEEKQGIDFTKLGTEDMVETYYKEFNELYELLALHRLLTDLNLRELLSEEKEKKIDIYIEDIKNGKKNQGIVDEVINNKAHFVHLTFAEYFAAFPLVKRIFLESTTITVFNCINSIIASTSPVFINSIIKLLDAQQTELIRLLEGKTLLNFVTQKGYLNFVQTLLEAGYDCYPEADNLDKTPLHYAAEYGHSNIVEYLLNYQKSIYENDDFENADSKLVEFLNKKDKDGNTAAYYAAEKDNMEIACDLLLKGANTDALKEYTEAVILHVVKHTHPGVVVSKPLVNFLKFSRILVEFLNKKDKDGNTAAYSAAEKDNMEFVFDPLKEYIETLILDVVKHTHPGVVVSKLLMNFLKFSRIRVEFLNKKDKDGNTAAYSAAEKDNMENACDFLLNGVNTDALKEYIETVILDVVKHTHPGVVVSKLLMNFLKFPSCENSCDDSIKNLGNFVRFCEKSIQMYCFGKFHSSFRKLFCDLIERSCTEHTNANQNNLLPPQKEKLLFNTSYSISNFNSSCKYPMLLSYCFVHGHFKLIKTLLGSINKDKKKELLNAEDESYTPLDRVNTSDQLSDDDRLAITKYLLENDGVNTNHYIGKCSTDSNHITNILQATVQRGHIKTFKYFIDQENHNYYNLHLSRAIECQQFNIVQYLMENHRENIELERISALHTAVMYGANIKIIKYFIDNGEDINAKNDKGETPLFQAIYADCSLNVIKYLINHGAEFNIQDKKSYTPLYYTIKFDKQDITKYLLLECETDINLISDELTRIKVEFFANSNTFDLNHVDQNGMSRLHYAIQSKDLEWSKFLIRQGADINLDDRQGKTPLHWASELQQTEIVELLLQYGAVYDEIDINNHTPLDLIAQEGLDEIVWLLNVLSKLFNSPNLMQALQLLLDNNNNAMLCILNVRNANRRTLLHMAADTNDKEAMHILLEFERKDSQSVLIDARDFQRNTPLHLAAQKGYIKIVSLLLNNGAVFDAENNQGHTPESLANINDHKDIVIALQLTQKLFTAIKENNLVRVKNCINDGAYINAKEKTCKTPLHVAASYGQNDIAQFLLEKGANIEVIDINNWTPLHFAAENNRIEIVKLLLKNGAIFDAKDKQDKAPFELEKNESVDLLNLANKLFNDIMSDNPQEVVTAIQKDNEIDISTVINTCNNQGNTILHYAVGLNYFDIVKFLLQNGAIFNIQNKLGKTADQITDQQDIIDLLQSVTLMFVDANDIYQNKEKINVQIIANVRNDQGMTLLHETAVSGKLAIIKWLVEKGADINARNRDGKTPLVLATDMNQKNIIIYLKSKDENFRANTI